MRMPCTARRLAAHLAAAIALDLCVGAARPLPTDDRDDVARSIAPLRLSLSELPLVADIRGNGAGTARQRAFDLRLEPGWLDLLPVCCC